MVRGELTVAFFLVRLAFEPGGCLLQQEVLGLGLLGDELGEGFAEFLSLPLLLLVKFLEVTGLGLNFLQSESLFLLFEEKLALLLGQQCDVAL